MIRLILAKIKSGLVIFLRVNKSKNTLLNTLNFNFFYLDRDLYQKLK